MFWTWTSGGDTATGGTVSGVSLWYKTKLDGGSWSGETVEISYMPDSNLTANADHTLYVQQKDNAGNWSLSGEFKITVDTTAPAAPTVDGPATTSGTPTTDRTPTWTWTSNGDGTAGPGVSGASGWYRYNIDGAAWSADTIAGTYTPVTLLNDGSHTLYVQERDKAGNWSDSGPFEVFIDGAPNAPGVTTVQTSPTTDTTPTWNWSSGGNGGSGNYIYKLDGGAWSAETTAKTYTPGALSLGNHTLYVQERDDDTPANWSASGWRTITIVAP